MSARSVIRNALQIHEAQGIGERVWEALGLDASSDARADDRLEVAL